MVHFKPFLYLSDLAACKLSSKRFSTKFPSNVNKQSTSNRIFERFCIAKQQNLLPWTKKNCYVTRISVSDFLVCNKNPRKKQAARKHLLLQLKFVTANFGLALIINIDFNSESSLASIKNKSVYSNNVAAWDRLHLCHLKRWSLEWHTNAHANWIQSQTWRWNANSFYQNICEWIK